MARRNETATDELLNRMANILEKVNMVVNHCPAGYKCLERMKMKMEIDPCMAEYRCLQIFLKNSPPKFEGGFNPDGAYRWLYEIEKIFRIMQYSNTLKAIFAPYMLVGEAENWWNYVRSQMENGHKEFTWELFRKEFLKNYLPEDDHRQKEIEFMELKQGSMSVEEYATRFEALSVSSKYFQQAENEREKCIWFENGLRPELKSAVSFQGIENMSILVNKCRVYEMDMMNQEIHRQNVQSIKNRMNPKTHHKHLQTQKNIGPNYSKRNFKQNIKKPYQCPYGCQSNNKGNFRQNSEIQPRKGPPRCSTCHKLHFGKKCPSKEDVCFNCGQLGHFCYDCPENAQGNTDQSQMRSPVEISTGKGKLLALSETEAEGPSHWIQGKCLVNGHPSEVL